MWNNETEKAFSGARFGLYVVIGAKTWPLASWSDALCCEWKIRADQQAAGARKVIDTKTP
jgi:hypothetical protein